MKRLLIIFLTLSLFWFSCNSSSNSPIIIASASSARYPLDEIAKELKKETEISVQFIFSSSGKLSAQIREGAPYDIFLSADKKYPNELRRSNLITPPIPLAKGDLILWLKNKPKGSIKQALYSANRIALANPNTAPYGKNAIRYLKDNQYFELVERKLIFAQNVGQTTNYILSGTVDAAITSNAAQKIPELEKKGYWVPLDCTSCEPLHLTLSQIIKSKDKLGAKEVLGYLKSTKAGEIFNKYGYSTTFDKQ